VLVMAAASAVGGARRRAFGARSVDDPRPGRATDARRVGGIGCLR
jgi:hypothetical protein